LAHQGHQTRAKKEPKESEIKANSLILLARSDGFEPPTLRFEVSSYIGSPGIVADVPTFDILEKVLLIAEVRMNLFDSTTC